MGGDVAIFPTTHWPSIFQSTPPVWVVTKNEQQKSTFNSDFNPHHPCGWWPLMSLDFLRILPNFNPHHPCGWWLVQSLQLPHRHAFQSTPPVWVVTDSLVGMLWYRQFQSTPPVWVVTSDFFFFLSSSSYFNPHHPCGWWLSCILSNVIISLFQSTPPVWVVTEEIDLTIQFMRISIHTTRVGGDELPKVLLSKLMNISIHTTRVGGDAKSNKTVQQ